MEQQEDKTTKMRCYAEERKIAGFELDLQCNHIEGQCCWSKWMRVKGCRLRGQCGQIGVVGKRQTRVMIAGLRMIKDEMQEGIQAMRKVDGGLGNETVRGRGSKECVCHIHPKS